MSVLGYTWPHKGHSKYLFPKTCKFWPIQIETNSFIFNRVGTYNIVPKQKIRYSHSFGGSIRMVDPVVMICEPQHLDRCQNCEELPVVDYWKNFEEELVLCRACMEDEKEKAKVELKNKQEKLKRLQALTEEYKLVRYCGFYHRHEDTTAKVRLFHPKELVKKMRREHYLSQFPIKTSRAPKEERLLYG